MMARYQAIQRSCTQFPRFGFGFITLANTDGAAFNNTLAIAISKL